MRFLELARQMGKINADGVQLVLQEQRREEKTQGRKRVGEIAVGWRLMSSTDRDAVLAEQERRATMGSDQRKLIAPPFRSVQMMVVTTATLFFGLGALRFDWRPGDTASVVSFATYVALVLLEYFQDRRFMASLYRAMKPLSILIVALLAIYLLLPPAVSHLTNHIQQLIGYVFLGLLALLLPYAMWKAHSLRLAESRMGALKDIIIRVQEILDRSGASAPARRHEATRVLLNGLRNLVQLHPWNRILRGLSSSTGATTVLFFKPDVTRNCFAIKEGSYPDRIPDSTLRAFEWIRENHFPAMLNEREFEARVRLAKEVDEKNWQNCFMRMKDRFEHISICGWVYKYDVSLISRDASKCRAFDRRFIERLLALGYSEEDLRWVEVGSFMACPVPGADDEAAGVLLIAKNLRNGTNPEELDALIIASRIMGQILRATKEEQ
jgi:hypothetical protein